MAPFAYSEAEVPWKSVFFEKQHQYPFEAIDYLETWIDESKERKDFIDGEAYFRLIQMYFKVGKTAAAKQTFEKFKLRKVEFDDSSALWLSLAESNIYLAEVNAKKAKVILDEVGSKIEESKPIFKLYYYYQLGLQQSLSSLYEESLVSLNEAQKLAHEINETHVMIAVLSQQLNIQYYMQQYEESLANSLVMRELSELYSDDFFRISSYSAAMNIYYMLSNKQLNLVNQTEDQVKKNQAETLANEYIAKSDQLRLKIFEQAEEIGAFKSLLRAMIQLQNKHIREGENVKTVEVAKRTIVIAEKYKSDYEKAVSYNNMAIALRADEKFNEALVALKEADVIYTKLDHKQSMLWALEDYAIIYELMKDFEMSLEYYKQYHRDSMALNRQTNNEKVLELQKTFESEKNLREIERLSQQNLLNTAELKNQRILIGFTVALILVVAMWLLYIYNRSKVIAIKNEKLDELNQKLKEQALRDPLTKLHNRRFIGEIQEKLASTVVRRDSTIENNKNKIGLVLLDIDYFKKINDQYGHDLGDEVLIHISSELQTSLRAGDIAVRWGGEEFLVVLFDTNLQGVQLFCERMLALRNSGQIQLGDQKLTVTMSMGYALFPFSTENPHWLSWDESVKLIDNLLFIAKERGRNLAVTITPHNKHVDDLKKHALLSLDKHVDYNELAKQGLELKLVKPKRIDY